MMDLPVAAYKGRPADINTNILSDFHDFLRPAEQMTGQCTSLIRCLLQHCRSGDRWVLQLIGCMQNADQCSGPPSARATARLTRTRDIQFAHFLLHAAAQGKLIRTNQWIMRIDEGSQSLLCYVMYRYGFNIFSRYALISLFMES